MVLMDSLYGYLCLISWKGKGQSPISLETSPASLTLVLTLTAPWGLLFRWPLLGNGGQRAECGFLSSSTSASWNYWTVRHSSPQREVPRPCGQHVCFHRASLGIEGQTLCFLTLALSKVALMKRSWNPCLWNRISHAGNWLWHSERRRENNSNRNQNQF